jgi:hypothetical protein
MKNKITNFLLLCFDKGGTLVFSPGEVLKTKKSRKLFIWLFPFWIVYVILFFLFITAIGTPILLINLAFNVIKESFERIKDWINKPNE